MAFCSNCGTQLPDGTKFCVNCGAKVSVPVFVQPDAPVNADPVSPAPSAAPHEEPAPQTESAPAAAGAPVQGSYQAPSGGSAAPAAGYAAPQQGYVQPQPQSYAAPQPQSYAQPQPQNYAAPRQQGYAQPQPQGYAPQQQGYAQPQTQSYAAPQQGYAAAPQQKKSSKKALWFIIGGVALAAIVGVVLLLTLRGNKDTGAASDDPNLGVYNAVTAEMWGIEMAVDDLWEDGFSIELKDKGKCAMNIDGTRGSGKWSVDEDGTFHIKGGGVDCVGTLKDGVIVLENVMDMGVTLTFEKEGYVAPAAAPDSGPASTDDGGDDDSEGSDSSAAVGLTDGGDDEPAAAPDGLSELQKQWNGTWYGCLYFMEATGAYEYMDSEGADAYMVVDVDADGKGTFTVYSMGEEKVFAEARCEAYDYGLDAVSGNVLDTEMVQHNWLFRKVPDYDDQFSISDEVELEDGTIEFCLFMKKWGGSWQPEIDSNFAIVPPTVEDYMQRIAAGELPPIGTAPYGYEGSASGTSSDAFVSPTKTIEMGSIWYGNMVISNKESPGEIRSEVQVGDNDIYAAVDKDSSGTPYFEVYIDPEMDRVLYSAYIELYDDHMVPVIGDDDAWFFNQYLTPDQADEFTMYLKDGVIEFNRHFVGEYESFDVRIYLREDGTPWNEAVDPLPPGYEEYKRKLDGGSGDDSTAQPTGELSPGEPSSTGDGMLASKDDLFRLTKWLWNMDYEYKHEKATYDFIRDYIGVEGLDDGNKGPNDSNPLGDHYFMWKYDETTFLYVGFRPNENGDWVATNMNTSGFLNSDIPDSIEVSYD